MSLKGVYQLYYDSSFSYSMNDFYGFMTFTKDTKNCNLGN